MAKVVNTLNCRNDADVCRANGWGPGTRLIGCEYRNIDVIEITAIGRNDILAVHVMHDGVAVDDDRFENWTLSCREWNEFPAAQPTATETIGD